MGNPLQFPCLENSMDEGAWQATVHGVEKSQTQLSNFTSLLEAERGLSGGLVVKSPSANAGDLCLTPGSGRSLGEGNGNPLQYSCLENPMGSGAWRATVQKVPIESDTT